ncbi:MAG: hypothetical protein KJO40_11715 [Deltaproteobacteria bacterium]|nr:hypothetical protein [Deltaproteobacteria bacterium]NND30842.1 hypothetical protein [Myxococcales bacterium]MBT8464714.1 hypothetical protein [Deltaproteobacteria bacterium]MBT8480905.1 hypothetical protein [Deltaproteobacteria bacterium]NNK06150.1 hypothetical protein [Myxococcales bacterium]
MPVEFGQNQCVKTTPGCNTTNDCGLGFSCEGVPGACASRFECVGLWPDGRMECVEIGGTCSYITDCAAQQVGASPRTGGPPSCQAGYQP